MKKILLLFFGLILVTFTSFYFSKNENNGHKGRCTGSAYCTACSNCSRCGHCGAGGTCGVCSTGSSASGYSSRKKKKRSGATSAYRSNSSVKYYSSPRKKTPIYRYENNISLTEENFLYTIYKSVNIRSGAGKNYPVVETVEKNTKLIFLYEKSDWYKVKVFDSKNEGYVYKEVVR